MNWPSHLFKVEPTKELLLFLAIKSLQRYIFSTAFWRSITLNLETKASITTFKRKEKHYLLFE